MKAWNLHAMLISNLLYGILTPYSPSGFLIEANKSKDGVHPLAEAQVVDSVVDDVMTVCLVMDNMVKQVCALFMFLDDCPEVQVSYSSAKLFTRIGK